MLSEQLRLIEAEVDEAHLSNPIMRVPYGIAMWHLLTACEATILRAFSGGADPRQEERAWMSALVDNLVNHVKWPARWIVSSCPASVGYPSAIRMGLLKNAETLLAFSNAYSDVETIYTYASYPNRDLLNLSVKEKRVSASGPIQAGMEYEAYDRLAILNSFLPPIKERETIEALDALNTACRVDRASFEVRFSPSLIKIFQTHMKEILTPLFRMPDHWSFGNFTSGDFAKAGSCLHAIAFIQAQAQNIASRKGCELQGLNSAVLMISKKSLERLICETTRVSPSAIHEIVEILTLGTCGIKDKDPALQPLIPFGTDLAIAPSILLSSAIERNFLVLINRIEPCKSLYLSYTDDRERMCRELIERRIKHLKLRFWNGNIETWSKAGQIDLAFIAEAEKTCLIVELKSFLAPADPREIINKSEEIAKGIQQIRLRRQAYEKHPSFLQLAADFTDDYKVYFAVLSETSIGAGFVQDETVPVVNIDHFLRKLSKEKSLDAACRWMASRKYLPSEGSDFHSIKREISISDWIFEWHAIVGLKQIG